MLFATLKVHVYVRHNPKCLYFEQRNNNDQCHCPVWLQWQKQGKPYKVSASKIIGSRDMKSAILLAEKVKRHGGLPPIVPHPRQSETEMNKPALADAIQLFVEYKKGRTGGSVTERTASSYRNTLGHLAAYLGSKRGVFKISDVRLSMLEDWMDTWKLKTYEGGAAVQAGGKYSYSWNNWVFATKAFFKWCVRREYITKDPSLDFKVPGEIGHEQTMPFNDEEVDAILAAIGKVRIRSSNKLGRLELQPWPAEKQAKVRSLILVMLETGLGICDTTNLERSWLRDDNRLFLRRTKTGGEVFAKLPPDVADELRAVDNGEKYFFWNRTCKITSAVAMNDQDLRRVFRAAGVKGAHSYRFRDTFSIRLLQAGMDPRDVARLLGNTEEVVEKHYHAWLPKEQQELEDKLEAAREKIKLARRKVLTATTAQQVSAISEEPAGAVTPAATSEFHWSP